MLLFKTKNRTLTIVTVLLIAINAFSSIFLSIVLGNLITAATNQTIDIVWYYLIVGSVGFGCFMLLGIVLAYCKTMLIQKHNIQIKATLIQQALYQPTTNTSNQLSVLTNDVKQLETKGLEAELTMLSLGFAYFFALMTAIRYDFITTFVFVVGSLVPVLLSLIFRKQTIHLSQRWSFSNQQYLHRLKDYFQALETIKTYRIEPMVKKLLQRDVDGLETALRQMNLKVEIVNQLVYLAVMFFSLLLPFGFGVYRVLNYGVPLATFITIMQLSNSFRNPSLQMLQVYNGYATAANIKKTYFAALKNKMPLTAVSEVTTKFQEIALVDGAVRLNQRDIFKKVTMSIHPGDKILIVGPSGSGKSTLLRTIQQAIPLSAGSYLYNGIQQIPPDSLFALIRQQPLIFDQSIRFNITLGETFSQDVIDEAVKQACLTELVKEKGYDYQVGPQGTYLSVGQAQRIEIARALIRRRPIILADEITAALDETTASQIRDVLLTSNFTVIEAAHHLPKDYRSRYHQIIDMSQF